MSFTKRGLGSNLSALGLKELVSSINNPVTENNDKPIKTGLKKLPIEMLRPGKYQPRKGMDQEFLHELSDSIRQHGIIQPIVVRSINSDSYEIIAGERRWRAAQMAGIKEVPVVINELADREAMAVSLIENIQRENLNPIDAAIGLDRLSKEFNLTHQEVADTIGKSRTTVTNLLRLLGLNQEIKDFLKEGKLEMGHARALLSLPEIKQIEAANLIIKKSLSVRETEKLVASLLHDSPQKSFESPKVDPNILQLQNQVSEKIGAKVVVRQKSNSKGELVIQYNSLDELDGILQHIR
jgi:ParB family transcriptional regulator, chromosome partitioning protein